MQTLAYRVAFLTKTDLVALATKAVTHRPLQCLGSLLRGLLNVVGCHLALLLGTLVKLTHRQWSSRLKTSALEVLGRLQLLSMRDLSNTDRRAGVLLGKMPARDSTDQRAGVLLDKMTARAQGPASGLLDKQIVRRLRPPCLLGLTTR